MFRRLLVVLAVSLAWFVALPSGAATPVLVVYSFGTSGSTPDDLGAKLADKIAAEISGLGGVNVVRGAATAKPADYRTVARAAGADLYYSGTIAAVGTTYLAIENLVSTRSGTVVWSVSIHFRSLDEIVGEGGRVRDELFRGQVAPKVNDAAAGTPLVTPSPVSGFAVLPVTGSAEGGDRAYATRALVETLQRRGYAASPVTGATAIDPLVDGPAVCSTSHAQALVAGTLDTSRVAMLGKTPQTTAHVALRTYDCRAHTFDLPATVVNHIAPVANDAIRGGVEDAVSAFPAPS